MLYVLYSYVHAYTRVYTIYPYVRGTLYVYDSEVQAYKHTNKSTFRNVVPPPQY